MKRIFVHLFPLALLLTVLAGPVEAVIEWDLSNVTLVDGSTVTGWFDYTSGRYLTAWDIYVHTPSSGYPQPFEFTSSPLNSYAEYDTSLLALPSYYRLVFASFSSFTRSGDGMLLLEYWLELDFLPADITNPASSPISLPTAHLPEFWEGGFLQNVLINNGVDSFAYSIPVAGGQLTVPAPVPEPSTLLLLGPGLAGLWVWGRKKFKCI
jgi:hypothetical protein